MRRAPLILTMLLATLSLSGCGGASAGTALSPGGAETGSAARVSYSAGVTDGRTGDAVTGTDAGPLRELSHGGRLDPSDPPYAGGRRDGVGAGDACTETDLLPGADNLGRVEASTLCLLNGERTDRGLPALTLNGRLAVAAGGHASDMVANSYFAHEGLDGSDIKVRIGAAGYIPSSGRWVIGENLAWGTGALATPKAIVNAWMNSEGHRANILHPDYREIGFGIVVGNPKAANGYGATYATEFGVTGDGDATEPRTHESSPAAGTLAQRPTAAQRRAAARKLRAKRNKARRARQSRRGGPKSAARRSTSRA
jgi:uncharacterized protein YkwD